MVLFSRNCSSNVLKPHLNRIVNKLLKFLQKGKKILKEAALKALASLANSSKEDFEEHYDTVISYLKVFLVTATESLNPMLVAKSLECITMVGLAVGKKMFFNDAEKVVELLILLQESEMETDNPLRTHLLQAWGRLCKCLGPDFIPFLGVAMPQVLQSAQMRNYLAVSQKSVNIDDSDHESMVEVTAGDSKLRFRASVLEEKTIACNILCCFAVELKEGLYLWINEVVHTLVPLICFKFGEDIRMAAVSAMPLILQSAVSATSKGLPLAGFSSGSINTLSDMIIPALLDALKKELRIEIWERILETLNKCIQISGSHLNESQVSSFVDGMIEVVRACSYRRIERAKRVEKGIDTRKKELLREEIDQEEKIYRMIRDCLGTLVGTFKASFLPFFDKIVPCIALMWGNGRKSEERRIALSIFRNVAEQCGEEAFRYYETCLPFLSKACDDDNPDVRQVVACAIGICAEFGGQVFKPYAEAGLAGLKAIIEHRNALQPANLMAYEAALSALGKICLFHCEGIMTYEVISLWLSRLPIYTDSEEAKIVHEQLCTMIEKSEKKITGPQGAFIPRIFAIFAQVLWAGNNLATDETISRMIKHMKRFQQKLTHSEMETICSSLTIAHGNMLRRILSL